jgi:hypothetical protein
MFLKTLFALCCSPLLIIAQEKSAVLYNHLLTGDELRLIRQGTEGESNQQAILIVLPPQNKTNLPAGTLAATPLNNHIEIQPKETVAPVDQPKKSCCAGCCKKTGQVCNCCLKCCSTGTDCLNLIVSCCQVFSQCFRR